MRKKILVVDDKPFMLRLIQHHLERAGYQLIQARNNKEAAAAMGGETPELMVLNDEKTEVDGQFILENNGSHSVPIIRMTDLPQGNSAKNSALDSEVVLTRPFSPTQLVAEVKRLIHKEKSQKFSQNNL